MEEIKVRLDNRVLKVPAEDKEKYLQQGYTVYDTDGKLIAEPATDANKLKRARAEIASLTEKLKEAADYAESRDKEIDTLKTELATEKAAVVAKDAEIASLTEKLKEAKKAEAAAKTKASKASAKDADNAGK